jgi:Uma2 family endonuclease
MSVPASAVEEWTYADYARLPDDGNRYEVIDGEVFMTPAPGTMHQHWGAQLFMKLFEYVRQHGLGVVLWDVDLLFVTGQYLRPDMVFVARDRLDHVTNRGVECQPGLVVEVLSPNSKHVDLVKKPSRYGDFGIPEYWVLDTFRREMLVYRFAAGATKPETLTGSVEWQPAPRVEPLRIEIDEVLRGF